MIKIYLDDERLPNDDSWTVVQDYDEFVDKINQHGLENISTISLDHDLGDEAIKEYYKNVKTKNILNYKNIKNEKTGLDCCKFIVNKSMDENKDLPQIFVHSKNPVGRENMMSYINNYLLACGKPQTCSYNPIPHTLKGAEKRYLNPKQNEK